jgi:integrase
MPRKRNPIPQLVQRGDTYYVTWYRDGRTERLSLRTGDAREAQARYAAFLTQGQDIVAPAQHFTCGRALEDYLSEHRFSTPTTYRRQKVAAAVLRPHFGGVPVRDVDVPACRRYAEARLAAGVTSATARRELAVLLSAANHAVKWRRITRAELPTIELPPAGEPRQRWLSEAELHKLLYKTEGAVRLFSWIAYYTGARRDSIEKLTWFAVDLPRRRIDFTLGAVKTRKRRAIVAIDSALVPMLEAAQAEATSEFVMGSPRNLYADFTAACEKLGLEGVTPHVLRHTRATHLLHAGKSIWHVAKLLGDTVETVERYYGHHCADHMKDVLDGKGAEHGS